MRSRFFSTGTTASSSQGDIAFDGKPWFDVTHSAYGATGDGSTNDATAIQAALNAANTAGGGIVFFPKGTYTVGATLLVYSNTTLVGQGRNVSTIKLANSANTDLMRSAQFSSLTGTNTLDGDHYINLEHLTLDGNKANNASGWVLKKYGSLWFVSDCEFMNGKSGGVHSEYTTNASTNYGGLEDYWESCHFHHNTGDGLQWRGPHDSIFVGCLFHSNTTGSTIEAAAAYSADSCHFNACHWWANNPTTGMAINCNTNIFLTDCHVEGMYGSGGIGLKMTSGNSGTVRAVNTRFSSNDINVLLQTSNNLLTGCQFILSAATSTTSVGVQIGDGGTSSGRNLIVGCNFESLFQAIDFDNNSGNNFISGGVKADSGQVGINGTPLASDVVLLQPNGAGTAFPQKFSNRLVAATGNEVAFDFAYTVDKATSGDDTGLRVSMTDTASPGTTRLASFQVGGSEKLGITGGGSLIIADAASIAGGTSTGTKIMTSTSQKLGFHNSTPVAQQTVTGSRGGNAALADLLTKLATLGLIADGTSA